MRRLNLSISDVKGPNKWRATPLMQLDEKTVEARRRFLSNYLQTIAKLDGLGSSFALKEFLAYEADSAVAFVKKAREIARIDKVSFANNSIL